MTRRWLVAFLVAVATAAASPAGAVTRDVVRLAEGQTVSRDYPDMGPAAGTENETALPAVCEASPTCDLIPLTIVLPADYSPSNDFAIQIRLDWETEQLPNDQGQANDLDLFLWGLDEEGGDELIARSVGTRVPEIVGAGQPDKGDYKVTVRNSLGYNAGYKLTFRWISGRIDLPEESEDPGRPAFTPGEDEPPRVAPPPAGGRAQPVFGEGSAAAPPDLGDPIRTPLGDAPVFGDPDFLGPGVSDLDALLQAPPGGQSLRFRRSNQLGPAEPPSGMALAIWLIVVPAVLAGGALLWFVRRRPAALSFNVAEMKHA